MTGAARLLGPPFAPHDRGAGASFNGPSRRCRLPEGKAQAQRDDRARTARSIVAEPATTPHLTALVRGSPAATTTAPGGPA